VSTEHTLRAKVSAAHGGIQRVAVGLDCPGAVPAVGEYIAATVERHNQGRAVVRTGGQFHSEGRLFPCRAVVTEHALQLAESGPATRLDHCLAACRGKVRRET